ncbi:hypothetical protein K438DRAFT_1783237 [Mycena galopus ATCC 62051]|nr:hypothetical protein K438DRAFT_1783237 [Mycena galopus ATCC 62051]
MCQGRGRARGDVLPKRDDSATMVRARARSRVGVRAPPGDEAERGENGGGWRRRRGLPTSVGEVLMQRSATGIVARHTNSVRHKEMPSVTGFLTGGSQTETPFVMSVTNPVRAVCHLGTTSLKPLIPLSVIALGMALTWAPIVFGTIVITGPDSAQVGANVNITWTANSTDAEYVSPPILSWNQRISEPAIWKIKCHPKLAKSPLRLEATIVIPEDHGPSITPPGLYNLTFRTDDGITLASRPVTILPSSSPLASSSTSGPVSNSSSSTPSPPSSSSPSPSSPVATTAKPYSNVAAIAGGVVAGTIVIIAAFLAGWCLRRRRASSVQEVDLTSDKPWFEAGPVGTTTLVVLANGSKASLVLRSDPAPEDTAEAGGSSTSTVAAGETDTAPSFVAICSGSFLHTVLGTLASKSKDPIILRWEPSKVAAPIPQEDGALSREEVESLRAREQLLEDEVRRLRDHVSALSPPSYTDA